MSNAYQPVDERVTLVDSEPQTKHFKDALTRRNTCLFAILILAGIILAIAILCVFLFVPAPSAYGVSSSNYYATQAGYQILHAKGNAIDAAVAIQAVLGLTEPMSSGFGGGCFILYLPKDGKPIFIDGREEAPNASTTTKPPSSRGGAISGIPGTMHAMNYALKTYGTMPLAEVLSPAIVLATDGYVLDEWYHTKIAESSAKLKLFPSSTKLWFDENGNPFPIGHIMVNHDYADMLRLVVHEGIDAFYNGSIAEKIVNAIVNDPVQPGVMTLEDLANYRSVEREPITWEWEGYTFIGPGMPSSGPVTQFIALSILEYLKEGGLEFPEHDSKEAIALLLNALSVGFADRNVWMGDGDWFDVPMEGLLDKAYAQSRAHLVNQTKVADIADFGIPPGAGPVPPQSVAHESDHTSHFTVVDSEGNIACVTTTIEATWGSGLVVEGTGFLLNNELSDFSPSGVNGISGGRKQRKTALYPMNETFGGKRPRSSMSPTIILKDGKPILALGSPGGANIISTVLTTIFNIFHYNMSIVDAVLAPRFTTTNSGVWRFEQELGNNQSLMQEFLEMGLNSTVILDEHGTGAVCAIGLNEDGSLVAVADPRKVGAAKVSRGEVYP